MLKYESELYYARTTEIPYNRENDSITHHHFDLIGPSVLARA